LGASLPEQISYVLAVQVKILDSKIFFIFPGQGSQYRGMGADLVEQFPCAREIFDQASEVVGYNMTELCFKDPKG